jgi:hypothetical protein
VGALILIPSLFVLFRLVLAGRFDPDARVNTVPPPRPRESSRPPRLAVPLAVGVGASMLLVIATVSWLQVVAALAMLGAIALAMTRLVALKQPSE